MHPAVYIVLALIFIAIVCIFRIIWTLYIFGLTTPVTVGTILNYAFSGVLSLVIDPLQATHISYFLIFLLLLTLMCWAFTEYNRRNMDVTMQHCTDQLITTSTRVIRNATRKKKKEPLDNEYTDWFRLIK